MSDRLNELNQKLVEELGHIGLHVKQLEPRIGLRAEDEPDDEGNPVPRVDLNAADDAEGALVDGVKSGDVIYGLDVVCSVNQMAWTDRILHPEQHEMDTQAEILLGDDDDAIAAYIASELENGVPKSEIRIPPELLEGD